MAALQNGRVRTGWVAAAAVAAAFAGCATAATKPEEVRLVWPPPPLAPRIEFVKSIVSDKNLDGDSTFRERLANFLGGEAPAPNRIVGPMGLAVSDDGHRLYVSDFGQFKVFVFDFVAKKFRVIGNQEPLARPLGIALDGEEHVYVVEQEEKRVSVFDRDGKRIKSFTDPSLERPSGIAIDRERGRIYVADTGHTRSVEHTVKIFSTDGGLIGKIGGTKGETPGHFMFPTYVTVDRTGNVYVTDTLNSRVQVFQPDGRYVRSFGQRGNAWGMFDKPKGVGIDSFGNVYVVDSGWSNVQIFNQKGQVLLFFGGRGPIPGMLRNPTAIAIGRSNDIYVGDYLNHRVDVYRLLNTTAADSFTSSGTAEGGDPRERSATTTSSTPEVQPPIATRR